MGDPNENKSDDTTTTDGIDPFDLAFDEAVVEKSEQTEEEKAEAARLEKEAADKAAAEKAEAEKAEAERLAAEEAAKNTPDPLKEAQAEVDRLKKELEEKSKATPKTAEPTAEEKAKAEKERLEREESNKKGEEEWAAFKKDWAEPAAMMEKMYAGIMGNVQAMIQAAVTEAIKPLAANAAQTAEEKFRSTVTATHADGFTLIENGEVDKWIETLPSYQKAGALKVLEGGDPSSVVELLSAFKEATGKSKPPEKTAEELAAEEAKKAQENLEKERKLRGLSVVPDKRSAATSEPDKNDFDGAFDQAVGSMK